jgi:phosphoribosylaminoimidazolecarboxamide formyltransferase/IMP cyclohydrolase
MKDLRTIKRALLSVSDKTGLLEIARALNSCGVELISTGGTAKTLRDNGLPVTEVSEVTGFPEMMDGRVKTLHPKIHGGLLALRDDEQHVAALNQHGIAPIDLLVINLYPFEQTIAKEDVTLDEAIENIDIGGPAMIRSAAKNWRDVAVVTSPTLYATVCAELERNDGALTLTTRAQLAQLAFTRTSIYDTMISTYLAEAFMESGLVSDNSLLINEIEQEMRRLDEYDEDFPEALDDEADEFPALLNGGNGAGLHDEDEDEEEWDEEQGLPDALALDWYKTADLRYGENPHQQAALYEDGEAEDGIAQAELLNGKEMSYNNFVDADAAWALVCDFDETACAIIKHTNPAGVGLGATPLEAYQRALATDPVSAFGGIVAFNRTVDEATAQAVNEVFTEVVIAPDYERAALRVLQKKKNLRVLATGVTECAPELVIRPISGGLLVQTPDDHRLTAANLQVVTQRAPTEEEIRALLFAWQVCKHTKSNAIVFAREGQTLGVGAGQMNRADSVRIAALRAERFELAVKGSVLASDAFFPFRDGLDEAAAHGITAVIQPGGSVRDAEVIQAANEHGLAMVFTGIRHFRH